MSTFKLQSQKTKKFSSKKEVHDEHQCKAKQMRKRYLKKVDTVLMFDPRVHMNLTAKEKYNLDEIDKLEENMWFVDVAKMGAGKSFGELALISDQPRAATIKCLTQCSFATLSKSDYKKFLQRLDERQANQKVEFLMELPFLKNFTQLMMKRLVPSF